MGCHLDIEPSPQARGQLQRLIETTLPQPAGVTRNRHQQFRGWSSGESPACQLLRQQFGEQPSNRQPRLLLPVTQQLVKRRREREGRHHLSERGIIRLAAATDQFGGGKRQTATAAAMQNPWQLALTGKTEITRLTATHSAQQAVAGEKRKLGLIQPEVNLLPRFWLTSAKPLP